MKKIITVLILLLSLSISTFTKEKAQSKKTSTTSQGNPLGMNPPEFLTINGNTRVNFNGIPLDLLTKKGRDAEARNWKLTGYGVSGKIDIDYDFYNYFNSVIVVENDYMKKLETFADLTATEKESLLDEISANFIKNWDKKTVKSIISNKTDKKFNNKTNGITFRRWLEFANQDLADYIKELIGDEYLTDATKLEKLLAFADDKEVHAKLAEIKLNNKLALKRYFKDNKGIELDENSIIDTQIKRFHEYKRQQMNALYVIHKYLEIKNGNLPKRKITVIFGGKAAPAYIIAQDIIHLILCLSELINNDPEVNKYLNVHLVENYNVTVAEKLIPATDISEQISLASKEASGTGNMKFMLNGALTLGTMEGANVEIAELVGSENIYIFGKDSDTIIDLYDKAGYVSADYYNGDENIKRAVDFIVSDEVKALGNEERLARLHHELISKDWFMTLIDLAEYIEVKEQVFADYEDQDSWNKKVVHNIAKAGFFSSDRTIAQYNEDIWHSN